MRPITIQDLPRLGEVIDSTGLFPSELLSEMTHPFFNDPETSDIWLTEEIDNKPGVVIYCAPERLTAGTYNLYLIAVHKKYQGHGAGSTAMTFVEQLLKSKGVRILIVETSGLPAFALTRAFYDKLGYQREAVIREFYQKGEDKIVFWKKLVED